jgi:hypothetical protein
VYRITRGRGARTMAIRPAGRIARSASSFGSSSVPAAPSSVTSRPSRTAAH